MTQKQSTSHTRWKILCRIKINDKEELVWLDYTAEPSAKVFELLFNSEYFLRDQLGSLVATQSSESSQVFEGELKEFVDNIDFKDDSPVDIMVSFEAFKPLFENVIQEMSLELGKYASLSFAGDNLYVDRTLVTRLSGPLTQIYVFPLCPELLAGFSTAFSEDAEKYIKIFTLLDRETVEAAIAEHKQDPGQRKLQKLLARAKNALEQPSK